MGNSNSSSNPNYHVQYRVIARTPQDIQKKHSGQKSVFSPANHLIPRNIADSTPSPERVRSLSPQEFAHLSRGNPVLGRVPRLNPPGRASFAQNLSVNTHAPIRQSLLFNQPREPLTPPTPAIATVQKPCARYVHATCSHKNHLYLFGGFDGNQYLNDLYRFDIIKKQWKLLSRNDPSSDKPLQRSDHHVIYRTKEHEVVLFAGWRDPERLNDTWAYNLKKAQWRRLPIRNESRMFFHGLTLGSHIYHKKSDSIIIFGGQYGNDESNRVFQLSFADNTWYQVLQAGELSEEPVNGNSLHRRRRTDASSSMQQQAQQLFSQSIHEEEDECKNPPIPEARENHTAVWYQDEKYMVIFGGWTGGKCLNDMWLFNMHSHKWSEVKYKGNGDSVPAPRGGHSAVMINDRFLYIYGGYRHPKYFDDLWVFDMESRRWHQAQFAQDQVDHVAPPGSWFHTLNLLTENDRDIPSMVLFGGEDQNSNMLGETLVIQPDDALRKYWYPNRTVKRFQQHMKDNLREDSDIQFTDVIVATQS